MAILRSKQIKAMPEKEMDKKMAELRLEMMKEIKPGQGASIKTREIKRTIARLLTAKRSFAHTQIKSNK